MQLNSPNVTATTGNTTNPFQNTGVVEGRHTLITHQGFDHNTGNVLPFIPNGETSSIRLGNEQAGSEAESITYYFSVDPENSILLLNFAVVLEDPNHPTVEQPRFIVRVMNAEDSLIESCAEYDVYASAGIPGFTSYNNGQILWRNWTKVGLNLSDYIGQNVKLQIITYDCSRSGHFGYAYFTATCINNRLDMVSCQGNQVVLSAPEGFDYYLWNDGTTASTDTIDMGNSVEQINCQLTSATNCTFTLSATISPDSIISHVDTIITDTICQGDAYMNAVVSTPVQNVPGTFLIQSNGYHLLDCGATYSSTTLNLTVLQRHFYYTASVCQTETDFEVYGFHFGQNPGVGIHHYVDTLQRVNSTIDCDSIIHLSLMVYPDFNMPASIVGNHSPCTGETEIYTVPDIEELGVFSWRVPAGIRILSGANSATVELYFSPYAQSGDIVFYGSNGCGSDSLLLHITPGVSSNVLLSDTICAAEEYHLHDFNVQGHETGVYFYTRELTNINGCDSSVTLRLVVRDNPLVHLITSDVSVCEGDYVRMSALTDDSTYYAGNAPYPVQVGDIICMDGRIVSCHNFSNATDQALAVVFHVNETGAHGWAVSLQQFSAFAWENSFVNAPSVFSSDSLWQALADTLGYANTYAMQSSMFPAADTVDFADGWYLPALAQLRALFNTSVAVNESLTILGGYGIPIALMGSYGQYWSSTQRNANHAWYVQYDGLVTSAEKNNRLGVRQIRNF